MYVNRWQNDGASNVIEVSIWKWTDDKIMVQLMSLKCQYVIWQNKWTKMTKWTDGATNVIEVSICKWTDDKIMVQLMSLKCQYVSEQMTK